MLLKRLLYFKLYWAFNFGCNLLRIKTLLGIPSCFVGFAIVVPHQHIEFNCPGKHIGCHPVSTITVSPVANAVAMAHSAIAMIEPPIQNTNAATKPKSPAFFLPTSFARSWFALKDIKQFLEVKYEI